MRRNTPGIDTPAQRPGDPEAVDAEQGRDAQEVLRADQQVALGGIGWLDPEAQEGDRRLGQD